MTLKEIYEEMLPYIAMALFAIFVVLAFMDLINQKNKRDLPLVVFCFSDDAI